MRPLLPRKPALGRASSFCADAEGDTRLSCPPLASSSSEPGFGGLELATTLSEALGDERRRDADRRGRRVRLRLLEARRDVRRGPALDAVRLPYSAISKPGVRFVQERVTAIDPEREERDHRRRHLRRPTSSSSRSAPTTTSTHTPGLAEANEFYSVAGAERLARGAPGVHAAAAPSSASATRRSSARRRRASARCFCTTT